MMMDCSNEILLFSIDSSQEIAARRLKLSRRDCERRSAVGSTPKRSNFVNHLGISCLPRHEYMYGVTASATRDAWHSKCSENACMFSGAYGVSSSLLECIVPKMSNFS